MSTKVVPAPADQAKRPVRSEKPANQTEEQQAVQEDDERLAQDDSEEDVSVAKAEDEHADATASETSLSGDFSFGGALASAAASSGSLISEAEQADQAGFAQFDDGGTGGTILLIGALALVALGIVVLVDDGGSSNEAPTVDSATQAKTTAEDTAVTVTVAATDPDGDPLTYSVTTQPTHGTVTAGATAGSYTYTPAANYNGTDSFVVTATDPDGLTVTQTVNITITAVPDDVTGPAEQTVTGDEEAAITGTITLVDPDGDDVTYLVTGMAEHGTVVLDAAGNFSYIGEDDFFGEDSFTVTATSEDGSTATQVVNVVVENVNDDPVQGPLTTTELDVQADGSAQFVIDFTDPDGDTLDASSTAPAHGTIDPETNTYTPDAGYIGEDSFDVTVSDGNGGEVTYTVTVNVVEDLTNETVLDNAAGLLEVDAAGGAFVFTDDVGVRTDAIITNFGDDDLIEVTGISDLDDYSYTSSGGDIIITYNDSPDFTQIVIDGAAVNPGFVFDYDTAVAAVGFDFITIA